MYRSLVAVRIIKFNMLPNDSHPKILQCRLTVEFRLTALKLDRTAPRYLVGGMSLCKSSNVARMRVQKLNFRPIRDLCTMQLSKFT